MLRKAEMLAVRAAEDADRAQTTESRAARLRPAGVAEPRTIDVQTIG
jgi:hypothetical protein